MREPKLRAEEAEQRKEERLLEEQKLNEAFALIFKGPTGELCMNYLVAKTLHMINGPNFDAGALAHLEGQRFIVADIRQRIINGENQTP